jgi:hypothetical protein
MSSPSDIGASACQKLLKQNIESLFTGLSSDLESRRSELSSIRQAFYSELAVQAEALVNDAASALPQQTQEDRSALSVTINKMVKELGLSLMCPKTNRPATIVSEVKREHQASILRYRFYTSGETGRRASSTCYDLPHLKLCQAPLRIESFSQAYKDKAPDQRNR